MPINYDKLLALKIPDVEQTYAAKDCMLYALGVGLGLDPLDEDQLAFVYEKNLKVLPTMAVVLGYPGFWAKELDTGKVSAEVKHGVRVRIVSLHGDDVGNRELPQSLRRQRFLRRRRLGVVATTVAVVNPQSRLF
jgi:hypothetical protein